MAAGLIQGTVTTTSGETIEMTWLVDETGAPTKWYNVSHLVNSAGSGAAFGSGAIGATVLRVANATDGPGLFTEDAAAAADPIGHMLMAVRRDTLSASEVSNDGDNVALKATSKGELVVRDADLVTLVTGVAHDTADSGNASKIGARAKGALSGITLVSADDRTDIFAGLDGVQIARPHCPLEDLVSAVVACTSGANTSAVGAQGANIKFYLCGGMLYNNGSSNGACLITDGNGGTTKLKVPFPASTGTVFTLPVPIGFSANTAVYADPSGSDTIDVTLYGFKSKV